MPVRLNVAASSTLARQIEKGAPADVFLSANPDWMAFLEERGLVADVGARRHSQATDLGGQRVRDIVAV